MNVFFCYKLTITSYFINTIWALKITISIFYQQVVAFSFYGDPDSKLSVSRKYFQGIKDNLKMIPEHYEGWTLRYFPIKKILG